MKRSGRREKALDYAADSIRQLLTLAIGLVAFTTTFAKDFASSVADPTRWLALIGWILLALSAVAGLLAVQALAGQLEPTTPRRSKASPWPPPSIWAEPVKILWTAQWVFFALGLGCLVVFAALALVEGDRGPIPEGQTGTSLPNDLSRVLTIGPFPDASDELTEAQWEAAEDSLLQVLAARGASTKVQAIVLVGGVDRRSLPSTGSFSSNASLAAARALSLRSRLRSRLHDSIAVFAIPGGALAPEWTSGHVALAQDRRVDLYLLLSSPRSVAQ